MTTTAMNPYEASDDEILAGIRRHMTEAERLVPQPPAWTGGPAEGPALRPDVRSRIAFPGLAPFVLVAMAAVVVVGVALGGRPWGGTGANPGQPTTTIVYQLVVGDGQQITDADLEATVQVLQARLASMGVEPLSVAKMPPNRVSVVMPRPADADLDTLLALLGQTGRLEFVLLPTSTYGDANNPGSVPVPADGSSIDPALPAQFTGTDLDRGAVSAAADPSTQGDWLVNFAFAGDKATAFATWSGQHLNEFFAIVLDGKVLSVPYIKSQVNGGKGQISGSYTEADAKQLAALLQTGTLPFPVQVVSVSVGPTQPAGIPTNMGPVGTAAPISSPAATMPADLPTSGRTVGSPDAPVTLDVWQDYQCPNCLRLAQDILPRIVDNYVRQGTVKIVYHDFIVIDSNVGGTESADAANAALCAADLGKFATFQDWLWANQGLEGSGAFSKDRLVEIGRRAGLDLSRFQACLDAGTHVADVNAESASGSALSLVGTPSIVVNGHLLNDYQYETIAAAINGAVGTKSAVPSVTFAAGTTAAPGASPTAARSPSTTGTFIIYVVRSGDTLSAIANRFNVPLAALEAANPQIAADGLIEVGWLINIPPPA